MPDGTQKSMQDQLAKHDRVRGVFSTQEIRKVGTGTTTRKSIQKSFWYIEEGEDGIIMVQPLNSNYVPSGPKKKINRDELIDSFAPEPEFYVQTVFPKMRELNQTVARADRHRQRGETFSAEYEYSNALQVDEENVRANFGIGLTYLARGEADKADNIFERLVKLDAAFQEDHKHLFNEFGINLRKSNMLRQAIEYYGRALELSKQDENLHLNVARAYLEQKDFPNSLEHVLKALEINPEHESGVKFLSWLANKGLVPADRKTVVAAALARAGAGGAP